MQRISPEQYNNFFTTLQGKIKSIISVGCTFDYLEPLPSDNLPARLKISFLDKKDVHLVAQSLDAVKNDLMVKIDAREFQCALFLDIDTNLFSEARNAVLSKLTVHEEVTTTSTSVTKTETTMKRFVSHNVAFERKKQLVPRMKCFECKSFKTLLFKIGFADAYCEELQNLAIKIGFSQQDRLLAFMYEMDRLNINDYQSQEVMASEVPFFATVLLQKDKDYTTLGPQDLIVLNNPMDHLPSIDFRKLSTPGKARLVATYLDDGTLRAILKEFNFLQDNLVEDSQELSPEKITEYISKKGLVLVKKDDPFAFQGGSVVLKETMLSRSN